MITDYHHPVVKFVILNQKWLESWVQENADWRTVFQPVLKDIQEERLNLKVGHWPNFSKANKYNNTGEDLL